MSGRENKNGRISCYLCETPKMPWSVIDSLPNLPEGNVVCRSCINFEGVDRIGDVIADTVRQKQEFANKYPGHAQNGGRASGVPSGRDFLNRISAEKREQHTRGPDQHSYQNSLQKRNTRPIPDQQRQTNRMNIHSPNYPLQGQPRQNQQIQQTIQAANMAPLIHAGTVPITMPRTIPGTTRLNQDTLRNQTISNPAIAPIATVPSDIRVHAQRVAHTQNINQTHNVTHASPIPITTVSQAQVPTSAPKQEHQDIRRQGEATLARLNEHVPFRVRFKKEPSVRGRVFHFDCTQPRPSSELKVYIEYPIGSGKHFSSASAAAKQMSLDACGGNMDKMTPISSGFKFLEYEYKHRSDDWRLLGDLLTEGVRYFREPLNPDWIPASYNDTQVAPPPKISSGDNSDETDEDIIVVNEVNRNVANNIDQRPKRSTPPDTTPNGEPPIKRADWQGKNEAEGRYSQSPKRTPEPEKPNSDRSQESPPQVVDQGPNQNAQPSLLCYLCKQRLEASHFVQCPSQQLHRYNTHRFCFPCCQHKIRQSLAEQPTQEVFCPSGQRCAISGSQNPWAFMQAEIETILDRATSIPHGQRPTQG